MCCFSFINKEHQLNGNFFVKWKKSGYPSGGAFTFPIPPLVGTGARADISFTFQIASASRRARQKHCRRTNNPSFLGMCAHIGYC